MTTGKNRRTPGCVVERGEVKGSLLTVLLRKTRRGDAVTDMLIRGLWVSAWGRRLDLLGIPLSSHVEVQWARLAGQRSLYLDGDVTVVNPAVRTSRAPM